MTEKEIFNKFKPFVLELISHIEDTVDIYLSLVFTYILNEYKEIDENIKYYCYDWLYKSFTIPYERPHLPYIVVGVDMVKKSLDDKRDKNTIFHQIEEVIQDLELDQNIFINIKDNMLVIGIKDDKLNVILNEVEE